MSNDKSIIRIGLLVNVLLLILIIIPIALLGDGKSVYLRVGWHDDFVLIGIPINTRGRYIGVTSFIIIINILNVFISEMVQPKISYPIYNPDQKKIYGFTKNELQIYGNILYLIEATKEIILVLVTITQIDIAMISMLFGEITSIITIRLLLNDKKFIASEEESDDETNLEALL